MKSWFLSKDKTCWKRLGQVAAWGIPGNSLPLWSSGQKEVTAQGSVTNKDYFRPGVAGDKSQNPRKKGQLLLCQFFPVPGTSQQLLWNLVPRNCSELFNSQQTSFSEPSCSAGFGFGWLLKAAVKWELAEEIFTSRGTFPPGKGWGQSFTPRGHLHSAQHGFRRSPGQAQPLPG